MDALKSGNEVTAASTLCATLRPPASRTTGTLRTVDPQQRRELRTQWTSASAVDPRHLCEWTPLYSCACGLPGIGQLQRLRLKTVPDENSRFEPTVCSPRTQIILSGVCLPDNELKHCSLPIGVTYHQAWDISGCVGSSNSIYFILQTTTDARLQ